jgi:hypothetical protein
MQGIKNMSAVSGFDQPSEQGVSRRRTGYFDSARPYALDEHYWGYLIRSLDPLPLWLVLAQVFSWVAGIVLAIAAFGLWAFPSAQEDLLAFRLALSVVLLGTAAFLLWFASRGARSEIQVDVRQREVREIVRNKAGRPTLIGRYPFEEIGGVFLDRSTARGQYRASHASLVLRYRNTAQMLPVVHGRASDLVALRDRMGRDLMVNVQDRTVAGRHAQV